MPTIEVSIPEEVYSEFERLAEEEFVNRDEAVEQLLSAGVDAYTREYDVEEVDFAEEYADDMWDTAGGPEGSDAGEFGR
jgi:metal-responsive CopG/Arc/MetJ family transcriptional regulator